MNDLAVVTVGRDGLCWYVRPDGYHATTNIPPYAPVGVELVDKLSPRMIQALAWYANGTGVFCPFAFPRTSTIAALITRGLLTPASDKMFHEVTSPGHVVAALTYDKVKGEHHIRNFMCECFDSKATT